jgi:hypothetical protein
MSMPRSMPKLYSISVAPATTTTRAANTRATASVSWVGWSRRRSSRARPASAKQIAALGRIVVQVGAMVFSAPMSKIHPVITAMPIADAAAAAIRAARLAAVSSVSLMRSHRLSSGTASCQGPVRWRCGCAPKCAGEALRHQVRAQRRVSACSPSSSPMARRHHVQSPPEWHLPLGVPSRPLVPSAGAPWRSGLRSQASAARGFGVRPHRFNQPQEWHPNIRGGESGESVLEAASRRVACTSRRG